LSSWSNDHSRFVIGLRILPEAKAGPILQWLDELCWGAKVNLQGLVGLLPSFSPRARKRVGLLDLVSPDLRDET
jgi:hypothetical protein